MSKQIINDLKELVSENVITPDVAAGIEQYYLNKKDKSSDTFRIVLGILGSILVGSGIVLLVAHNWDQMGRMLQTFFAFLPLATGQLLCGYTLLKQKNSVAWRESSSIILFFAVASSIALVSQIYHISGTLHGFLLTWIFLTLPLIYIMRSIVVALLTIATATWFVSLTGYSSLGQPYWYLVIMTLIIPHYYKLLNKENSNSLILLNWFLVASVMISLGALLDVSIDKYEWIFIGYIFLAGLLHLIGSSAMYSERRISANPFRLIGVPAMLIILLLWSYDFFWSDITIGGGFVIFQSSYFYICLLLVAAHFLLLIRSGKMKEEPYDPMVWSPYIFLIAMVAFAGNKVAGILVMNLLLLSAAIYYIRKGAITNHLGILNFGLLIIAALALLRFFDDSIPFVFRGLLFVITGLGFFISNYMILKKRKANPL